MFFYYLNKGEKVIFGHGVGYFAFLFWGGFFCVFVLFVKLN